MDREGELLLLLDRPDRGEVRLPKGHIDPGEDERETALREVGEESGYADLEILGDLGSGRVEFEYEGDYYIRDQHYFLMALRSDARRKRPPKDEEQFRVRWVPCDRAAGELTYEDERKVVEQAVALFRRIQAS